VRAALVELHTSHDECLFSQALFLRPHTTHLALLGPPPLLDRLRGRADFDAWIPLRSEAPGAGRWWGLIDCWRALWRGRFDWVVFNTAQGSMVERLSLLPFPRGQRRAGILHDVGKLERSPAQRLISRRLDHYYVLADYLLESVPDAHRDRVAAFHAMFFPSWDRSRATPPIEPTTDRLVVCVPGNVERKRRDYEALLAVVTRPDLDRRIQFVLPGRSAHAHGDGPWLRAALLDAGVEDRVSMWNDFIDHDTFQAVVAGSDVVLPLVHPHLPGHTRYLTQRISGSFNLAFGHRRPLLMDQQFQELVDFDDVALFYEPDRLADVLSNLAHDPSPLRRITYANDRWTEAAQARRYLAPMGIP
jgi:hypothetical protein